MNFLNGHIIHTFTHLFIRKLIIYQEKIPNTENNICLLVPTLTSCERHL